MTTTKIEKAKETKKCVIKWILNFKDYKKSLQNNKTILRSQQNFKAKWW